jgi:hypothetical protein
MDNDEILVRLREILSRDPDVDSREIKDFSKSVGLYSGRIGSFDFEKVRALFEYAKSSNLMDGNLQVYFFNNGMYDQSDKTVIESFYPQSAELQRHLILYKLNGAMYIEDEIAIPELLHFKLSKMNAHDVDNRDAALVYIKILVKDNIYEDLLIGVTHPVLVSNFLDQNEIRDDVMKEINHRSQAKRLVQKSKFFYQLAFAALYDENVDHGYEGWKKLFDDYSGVDKAIYVDPLSLVDISLEDAAEKFKEAYPNYPIYVDSEGEIDVSNTSITHRLLLASRLKKLKNIINSSS